MPPANITEPRLPNDPPANPAARGNVLIYYAGLAFIYLACLVFAVTAFRLYNAADEPAFELRAFYPELVLCGIAVFTGLLGVSLLRSAGAAVVVPGPVIHPDEWETLGPKVGDGKEGPVTQYIRLRSLTGFPGTFTKLGLQGLPLATIGLTIFFALLAMGDDKYMDLAKLTLGAFIGSFVQKKVGEQQPSGGVVELPSGEKIRVQGPPPSTIA